MVYEQLTNREKLAAIGANLELSAMIVARDYDIDAGTYFAEFSRLIAVLNQCPFDEAQDRALTAMQTISNFLSTVDDDELVEEHEETQDEE